MPQTSKPKSKQDNKSNVKVDDKIPVKKPGHNKRSRNKKNKNAKLVVTKQQQQQHPNKKAVTKGALSKKVKVGISFDVSVGNDKLKVKAVEYQKEGESYLVWLKFDKDIPASLNFDVLSNSAEFIETVCQHLKQHLKTKADAAFAKWASCPTLHSQMQQTHDAKVLCFHWTQK